MRATVPSFLHAVMRARWIYGKSEDPPKEPFLDEWSKAEELAKEWLERMRKEFG